MNMGRSLINEIKTKNRRMIYDYIRESGQVSKQDILVRLRLSLPTITQNLNYLKERNLIDDSEKIKNTGGRSARAYRYIKDAKTAIGLYLTGKHISAVAINLSGEVISDIRERIKFDLDSELYLKKLAEIVEKVKKEAKIGNNLLGVGIALPGLISDDGGLVTYGYTLGFTGKTLEEIAKYIPYKCRLFHDSYVAGYMESWMDKRIQNGFYISLNNSVGGSIIINNGVYEGNTQKGGEIGHMIIDPGIKQRCYCGKRGCFDTVCNAEILDSCTEGNLEEFFEKLRAGDPHLRKIWDRYLENLALAIHNIRMLFDGVIILGGYIGSNIGEYLDDLCQRVDQRNPFGDRARDYLLECRYRVEVAAAGAAVYYINQFLISI
ncbi:MAG: ROK family protein [Johnsonella sp.]|nr:ROK family protein [Johnsonella sp.]